LAARGHHISIACCIDSRLEREAVAAEIDTIPINTSASAVGGAFDLRKVLAQRFIEVAVVTTERDHLIVGSAMRFAERGGVLRRVPSFAGLDLQRTGKLALKLAAGGVVISTERELKELKQTGWSIPATVAPLGVDVGSYDSVEPATRGEMRAPSQGLVIACSYDTSGRYRLGAVFRTLALLAPRHVNIHVVVFGPGSADDELRMHASALGVSPVVSFLGEREDEHRLMRAAHAGWVVSASDSGAYACLDFMALRVPVITDRSPLTQHFVADKITGLLLTPGDASYTASGIAAFLTDEEKRVAMGNAGRTRAQRDFPEAAMIDGFESAANAAGDRTKWVTK
jgi:glycosyltransferase involved in cell wall biosynthesis